jgi:hypothetical protein
VDCQLDDLVIGGDVNAIGGKLPQNHRTARLAEQLDQTLEKMRLADVRHEDCVVSAQDAIHVLSVDSGFLWGCLWLADSAHFVCVFY